MGLERQLTFVLARDQVGRETSTILKGDHPHCRTRQEFSRFMQQRTSQVDQVLEILKQSYFEELKTRFEDYCTRKQMQHQKKPVKLSATPIQASPTRATTFAATAAAPAPSPDRTYKRAIEWFVGPLVELHTANGKIPLKQLPNVDEAEKSDRRASTDSLERAHRVRHLTRKLQDQLAKLNELKSGDGRHVRQKGPRRLATFRKHKQEIMHDIKVISEEMAAVRVFRPLLNHERINPQLYVTPKMLGHEEAPLLDVFVCDLFETEKQRNAHRQMILQLFPELEDQSFLSVDVGTVVPVAGFDILNGRLFKIGESISHRLIKKYDNRVAEQQSAKSKKKQMKCSKQDQQAAETLSREIDDIDEEIHDLYQRRRNVATRVHQSIMDVIQLYDCVLMPHLNQTRRWPSTARKQACAIRLQDWQRQVKDLCEQRRILLISHYPESWTTATCLSCQAVNNPEGRRVYKCSNKSCVKNIERLVTLRDPESSIKIGLSLLWRLLQSRKESTAILAKGE